jgi:hypothetical protein
MSNGTNGPPYYGRARIAGGLLLLGLVVVLALIDTVRPDFALEPIPLGMLLGTSLLMLGIEAGRRFIG